MDKQFLQNQLVGQPKKNYWKFAFAFLGIIVIVSGGFFVWDKYFSPAAKLERQNQENYQKYLDWQVNYEKAMTEDTYGGKTPEETLQMFIEALKKEDIELAGKYFALETNTNDPNYLTTKKWEDALLKAKNEGRLNAIISQVSQIKLTFKDEDGALFKAYDAEGEIKTLIEIKLNKDSNVWKIESM